VIPQILEHLGWRFLSKIDVREPDECWPWTGAITSTGYPQYMHRGRNRTARRLLWETINGPLQGDMQIVEENDIPICMNPRHLKTEPEYVMHRKRWD
jgi:hypothetical protein